MVFSGLVNGQSLKGLYIGKNLNICRSCGGPWLWLLLVIFFGFQYKSTRLIPVSVASYVDLPSIALVAHRYEALLAAGFIFSIHFLHTHMLPENIPTDEAMFTGKIDEEHVKHEKRCLLRKNEGRGPVRGDEGSAVIF